MRKGTYFLSLLLIFTIPWEGVVRLPTLGTGARAFGLFVAVTWVLTVAVTGRLRKPTPFHVVLCLFIVWNAAGVLWSHYTNQTIAQTITWIQLLVFVYMLWDLYTTNTSILAGLQAYVFGSYVAIGGAVSNFFVGNASYTNFERYSAGDTNPDGFGFIVVLAIPIAWHLAVSKYRAGPLGHLLTAVNFAYIPLAILGVSLSGTRTALIAALPGMAFGLMSLSRPRPAVRFSIFILLTLCILILLPKLQDLKSYQRLSTTGTELTQGDLNQRAGIWQDGFASFVEHPLVGIGGNTYRSINRLGKVAHNSYLSVLVELGLIGFMLFATMLLIAVLEALRLPKWPARFWLTILCVWAIGASTLTWEHRKTTWLFLILLIADASLSKYQEGLTSTDRRSTSELSFRLGINRMRSPRQVWKRSNPI